MANSVCHLAWPWGAQIKRFGCVYDEIRFWVDGLPNADSPPNELHTITKDLNRTNSGGRRKVSPFSSSLFELDISSSLTLSPWTWTYSTGSLVLSSLDLDWIILPASLDLQPADLSLLIPKFIMRNSLTQLWRMTRPNICKRIYIYPLPSVSLKNLTNRIGICLPRVWIKRLTEGIISLLLLIGFPGNFYCIEKIWFKFTVPLIELNITPNDLHRICIMNSEEEKLKPSI